MNRIGEHAVVLGASMAGLLTARVLADFYGRVTVVERDVLPEGAENRRGVPQGRHGHVLLASGAQVIGELFPGILDELVADGVPVGEGDRAEFHFAPLGHLLCQQGRFAQQQRNYLASRPCLEGHVRRRLRGLPNVTVMDGHDVAGLVTAAAQDHVTGVRVAHPEDGERTLTADLVVDALGRGARTPAWLAQLGYPAPAEDEVVVRVCYASRLLRIPAADAPAEKLFLVGLRPGISTGGLLCSYENDTWQFTVGAGSGVEPPFDPEEMITFAEEFLPAHAIAAIRKAESLTDVVRHRFPSSRWRRYDKLDRFPDGLLVTGDAFCSFNPLYGQGMSVAALEAMALRSCLERGGHNLPRRFFRAAAKPVGVAWQLATGADLALPEIEGPRPLSVRLTNAYVERVLTAAESDPVVMEQFMRVSGLLDPPSYLMRPGIVRRVITAGRRPHPRTESSPVGSHGVRGV